MHEQTSPPTTTNPPAPPHPPAAILLPHTNTCRLQWGLEGAAAAFLCSNATYALLMLFVVAWRHARTAGTPTHTWPGFTSRALRGWGHYLQYGIPAAAMICCEW